MGTASDEPNELEKLRYEADGLRLGLHRMQKERLETAAQNGRFAIKIEELEEEIASLKNDLRDRFAIAALAGIVVDASAGEGRLDPTLCAIEAYKMADAMLIARETTP